MKFFSISIIALFMFGSCNSHQPSNNQETAIKKTEDSLGLINEAIQKIKNIQLSIDQIKNVEETTGEISCGKINYKAANDSVVKISFSGSMGDASYDEVYYFNHGFPIYIKQTVFGASADEKEKNVINEYYFEDMKIISSFTDAKPIVADTFKIGNVLSIAKEYKELFKSKKFSDYECF
jgi:hypothetical protein